MKFFRDSLFPHAWVNEKKRIAMNTSKTNFTITISGQKSGRRELIGSLVDYSANLVTHFSRTDQGVVFFLRHKSDARFLLKRVAKNLSDSTIHSLDLLSYAGAEARISKIS